MALGTTAAALTGKRSVFNASRWIAAILTVGAALLTSHPNVGYAGAG
jgi:hypothetical protein